MGVVKNIDHEQFPVQTSNVGERCEVCFNYDTKHVVRGTVVRDDGEEPGKMIIRLDDGRYVLSTECMYSYPRPRQRAGEVWAIDIGNGTLLPPIDDDFCDCFMAFPSREDAEKALQSQRDKDYVDEAGGKVVKIG